MPSVRLGLTTGSARKPETPKHTEPQGIESLVVRKLIAEPYTSRPKVPQIYAVSRPANE